MQLFAEEVMPVIARECGGKVQLPERGIGSASSLPLAVAARRSLGSSASSGRNAPIWRSLNRAA